MKSIGEKVFFVHGTFIGHCFIGIIVKHKKGCYVIKITDYIFDGKWFQENRNIIIEHSADVFRVIVLCA